VQQDRNRKTAYHLKHEVSKGKENGHIKNGKKWEKESRQKQANRIAQGRINARQGPMGHHIKRVN
jgi:hypothetical protein